ncbi:MAG: hypothetical protein NZ455_16970, partial [Bacteroidia bacterium]|nr:hypothetical protein [Bacteroidia bacterium]
MKNALFKQKLREATFVEIPALLDTLQLNYDKIPSHLRSSFNQLKAEFFGQPNNFSLTNWQAKLDVLIGQFNFEIEEYN